MPPPAASRFAVGARLTTVLLPFLSTLLSSLAVSLLSHLPVLPAGHDSRALRHTWRGAGRCEPDGRHHR
ncbi:hypothetical protein JV56_17375 [Mycobacterium tuberculosis variant bovis]|nr:hypothetical protein IB71_17000 [Mycobacterium tuberculosis variant bovis]KEY08126.1 hypothetical protein IB73_17035 [Mycobacterium tuberculosis variant bovis]KEY08284.1 hypothetical protein IB72_17065 [Mycobacterium tuberculosis variant bovis]KFW13821.1 hypothetical protein JV56_17375 [Mycobacterium tuberculosis variant bovis]KFW15348.1 hypothetical protein JV49_17480 [Mycobacterium tuberculosis variant bovis]